MSLSQATSLLVASGHPKPCRTNPSSRHAAGFQEGLAIVVMRRRLSSVKPWMTAIRNLTAYLGCDSCGLPNILKVDGDKGLMRTHSSPVGCQEPITHYYGRRSFITCRFGYFRQVVRVGDGVPLPRPRIQVVHGTVPQKCARNRLPAQSGILCRPALGELSCRRLPTSSMRAPEVTPN